MTIRPIAAAQTYPLRHAGRWPNQPLADVQLSDDDDGQHFGAFEAEELVAVISLFVGPDGPARFRKFATAPPWQGRDLGAALLRHLIVAAVAQGARTLWGDARQNMLTFYERFGLRPTGDVCYKSPIAYVRLRIILS